LIKRWVLPLAVLLTGCSSPVALDQPQPSGAAATACRELLKDVPEVVEDQSRREVQPSSPYTAAWGDPAITLACGVAKPAGLNAASECFEVNGVGWFSEERAAAVRFTSIGRSSYVQVTVPKAYVPANPLVDLAKPVDDHIPVLTECV
jgi:hypothetical protein